MSESKEKIAARFWKSVQKTKTHWIWCGQHNRAGYGRFKSNGKNHQAHRFILKLLGFDVPKEKDVDHLCRVRNCVNPDHLEVVTHRENILRGNTIMAENARKTHCKRGHELSGSNLRVNNRGERQCRKCESDRKKLKRANLESIRQQS